jgi:amino acid adenylation domain-containing protein/thioester reductase-like protein
MTVTRIDQLSAAEKRAVLARLMHERRPHAEEPFPLSEGQRALWFMYQLAPENTALNLGEAVVVRGELDVDALRRAIALLAKRHPALRTLFASAAGSPVQQVRADRAPELVEEDASGWTDAEITRVLAGHVDRPFRLEEEAPFRVVLIRRAEHEHLLVLVLHHIVGEFWALVILMGDLATLYRAEASGTPHGLAPLDATYADFVRAQAQMLASPVAEQHWQHWKRALSGDLPVIDLPTDRLRPAQRTYAGALRTFTIDEETTRRVRAFSRTHGVTNYVTLLSAFVLQLHRWSGQNDIVVGTPMTGRTEARFAGVVGYFDNPLPLRVSCEDNPKVADLVARVRNLVIGAFEHQAYPLQRIVERAHPARGGTVSASPLFDVMFVLRQSPDPAMQKLTVFGMGGTGVNDVKMEIAPGITIEPARVKRQKAQFDLALSLAEVDGKLYGSWEYSTELFDETTIDRYGRSFAATLRGMIDDPTRRALEVPILGDDERREIIFAWNDTSEQFPRDMLLHEPFEAQCKVRPDALAVISDRARLTYRDLDRRSNAAARWLRDRGARPNQLVAIVMDKRWEQIVAALAVCKSGAAYLPLDPKLPKQRLLHLLGRGEVRHVLTQRDVEESFPWPAGVERLAIDAMRPSDDDVLPLPRVNDASDLAYTIFTSGSTGQPKGVMIDHRGPVNTCLDVNRRFDVKPGDRVLALSSLGFDLSVYDVFGTLAAGATIVVPLADRAQDPAYWVDLVERDGVTLWNSVPSLLKLAVEHVERHPERSLASLRAAMLSGDWIPLDLPARYRRLAPRSRFVSMGGATEGSIWSIWYEVGEVDPAWRSVPYGKPMANQMFYVLNDALEPCPVGVIGHLYIGGIGVTKGYWRDDEKTRAALVDHPSIGERLYHTGDLGRYHADGNIEFIGRADFQVKLRGFRVEIGEIEATLASHPAIGECVVVARGERDKRLVAYYTRRQDVRVCDLRRHLEAKLPDYMVPSAFVPLAELPLSSNGKLDRKALPEPAIEVEDAAFVAPRTDIETRLAAIWAGILAVARVGTQDDFFALGGDSVHAIQIAGCAQDEGMRVTSRDVFERPTIAALAERVAARRIADEGAPGDEIPVTPEQAAAMGHTPWTCVLASADDLDARAAGEAIDALVAHHDALRASIVAVEGGWRAMTVAPIAHGSVAACTDLENAIAQARSDIDAARGVMVRARSFGKKLVLAVHAAVMDAESWCVAVEDLTQAYEVARRGQHASLPACSASFRAWARRTDSSGVVRRGRALPAVHVASLDGARALLGDATRAYRATGEEIAAAAVVRALGGAAGLAVRGRRTDTAIDLSRVVGAIAGERRVRVEGDVRATKIALRQSAEVDEVDACLSMLAHDPGASLASAITWTLEGLERGDEYDAPLAITIGRRDERIEVRCRARGAEEAERVAERVAKELRGLLDARDAAPPRACGADHPLARLDDAQIEALEDRHGSIEEVLPLAPMQETMLLHALYEPDPALYFEHIVCDLHGEIDAQTLRAAFGRVLERHPALRASFAWDGLPHPVQVIERDVVADLVEVDWRGEQDARAKLDELIRRDRARGFDLRRAPLVHATLVRTADDAAWLVLAHHHLILDGWSLTILLEDLAASYDAEARAISMDAPSARPFADYLRWISARDESAQRAFWTKELHGFKGPTPIAIEDRAEVKPGNDFAHGEAELALSASDTRELGAFAQRARLTMGTLVMGAWALALARYAGVERVVVGVTGSGRPEDLSHIDRTIGLFITTVPLAIDVDEDRSVSTWLADVQAKYAAAREHEHVTQRQLEQWLGRPRAGAFVLYRSIIVFENYPTNSKLAAHGIRIDNVHFTEQTNTPLAVYALPGEALVLRVTFDRRQFDPATAERVLGHLAAALRAFAARPDAPLADISILAEGEKTKLLEAFNGTVRAPDDRCLHELLTASAARTPNAPAVIDGADVVTYAALQARASRMARYLASRGVARGDRVAIMLPRSADLIASIFGVLAAGAAYVPIDPSSPRGRIAFTLSDAEVRAVITCGSLAHLAGDDAIIIERDRAAIDAHSAAPVDLAVALHDVAYVIYTSGSTGVPKGVLVEHRNIVNYTHAAAEAYAIGPADRVLQFFTIAFDAAAEEIFPTLARGAALVLRPEDALDTMERFVEVLRSLEVSVVSLPTAVWHALVVALGDARNALPAGLRTMIIGGERALPQRVREWQDRVRGVKLWNTYGPTEATVVATMSELRSGDAPIGKPVANVRAVVMDARKRLCALGAPGELWIGGAGVARGYLNRPELTDERFVDDSVWFANGKLYRTGDLARWRTDGELEFLGRIDHQVKIRGFRVELGEIEAVIHTCNGVDACVVTTFADANDTLALAAYVVMSAFDSEGLRAQLRTRLPEYMVPVAIAPLDALPVNERGKVDRKALPPIDRMQSLARKTSVPPRDAAEHAIARVWSEVLRVDDVGVHDSFFELGGHSLLAIQLLAKLRDAVGVDMPLRAFFAAPTVADVAAHVARPSKVALDFVAESMLDEDVVPHGITRTSAEMPPREIFLTGATGFLGAFLLRELVDGGASCVHCLVRADGEDAAHTKIRAALERWGLWHDTLRSRIAPVLGDLAAPQLGLSTVRFQALARSLDAVVHNAAFVNFVLPYEELAPSNVRGTREVLRLAARGRTKHVHYVSSLAVFPDGARGEETTIDFAPDALTSGYAQTKWVAERLVAEARARGVPVTVYRPGRITGDSVTGAWNTDDLLCRMVKGCVDLGLVPDIDIAIDMTPVDYVARAVVCAVRGDANGDVFHLVNPVPVTMRGIVAELRTLGHAVREVALAEWLDAAAHAANANPNHALYPLLALLPEWAGSLRPRNDGRAKYECSRTAAALDPLGVRCPPIDRALLRTYFGWLARNGALPSTGERR